MELKEKIRKAFIEYCLENDHKPSSVYILAKKMKIKEEDFYEQYNSLETLENDIWLGFFEDTRQRIESEEVYASYSVREKVLAFYYTWLEVLKSQRSFVIYAYHQKKSLDTRPSFLEDFRRAFKSFVEELLIEARESQEIADRRFASEIYPRMFWLQTLAILKFWVKDRSQNFEKTDVLIEKTVNFGFDAMGKSALDSAFDLFKFAFQNR
jgi:AcrR family transcriptional regulator